jgi:hypothetical protein
LIKVKIGELNLILKVGAFKKAFFYSLLFNLALIIGSASCVFFGASNVGNQNMAKMLGFDDNSRAIGFFIGLVLIILGIVFYAIYLNLREGDKMIFRDGSIKYKNKLFELSKIDSIKLSIKDLGHKAYGKRNLLDGGINEIKICAEGSEEQFHFYISDMKEENAIIKSVREFYPMIVVERI